MINYVVIPLGEILNSDINRKKIEKSFKKFSCHREEDLENFLTLKAITYENANFGKTYLLVHRDKLIENNEFVIMAYFTVAQKSVDISSFSKAKRRKILSMYPGRESLNSIPAYLIGQLGRCDDYSNTDISGEQILNECYNVISNAAQIVGGNLIILECRECMFEKFYEKQNYKKLYNQLNDENLYTLYKKINFSEYWNRYKES